MSERAEKLKAIWDELFPDEKAELLAYFESQRDIDQPLSTEEWQEAWFDEINRRVEACEKGESIGIPADEFMEKMKAKYG